jgi:hypothetical protein
MHLPGGVRVVSNGVVSNGNEWGEFLEAIGKKMTDYVGDDAAVNQQIRAAYLKYIVGKFRDAYGDRAKDAFYVYMQNFTGSGNLTSAIALLPLHCDANNPNIPSGGAFGGALEKASRHIAMTMDENFNATYDIVYDSSESTVRLLDEEYIRENMGQLPPRYSGNSVMVTAIRSYIPAAYNPEAADPWDQRGQRGKQETHCSFIVSHGNSPAAGGPASQPSPPTT